MIYSHTYTIQCAHFNNAETYEFFGHIRQQESVPLASVIELLQDMHGHNFTIVITLEGNCGEDRRWLIEDEVMTAIVMQWHNCNITLHADFFNITMPLRRITTELMAEVLCQKLCEELAGDTLCTVRVYETPEIFAEAEFYASKEAKE
jgi:6-pyruvoyl-tetrahydropterin synthase